MTRRGQDWEEFGNGAAGHILGQGDRRTGQRYLGGLFLNFSIFLSRRCDVHT